MPLSPAVRTLLSLAVLLVLRSLPAAAPAPLAAQCTDVIECGGGGGGPFVTVDPESGSWSASAPTMQVVVNLYFCSSAMLVSVELGGQSVLSSFTTTTGSLDCTTPSTAAGTITLDPGRHTLVAKVVDGHETATATAVYTYTQTGAPPASGARVSVTPDAQPVTRGAAQRATERFTVANDGSASTALSLGRTCTGAGVTACTLSHAALTVPGGGIVSVGVNYTTGGAGTAGTVALAAWKTGDSAAVNDAGSRQVSVIAVPVAGRAGDPSETTAIDRSACLMLPAGLGGVYECGDLRLAHGLPATRVLNRAFAPTLLYNSQHAYPFPLVSAEVLAPSGSPAAVVVSLTVSGVTRTREYAPWASGSMRLGIGFDATGLATGFYGYDYVVRARYADGSTVRMDSLRGTMPIVNRSGSRFGRGWWMAGVEEVKSIGDGSLMWIGGDGSTLRYNPVSTQPGRWAPEAFAGTDTIVQLPSDTATYARVLTGGDTVFFDWHGRHRRTVNRSGHSTLFEWASDALTRMHLPRGQAFDPGTHYTLEYANPYGMLSRVLAPGVAASRVVTFQNTDGRVTAIGGPDTTGVVFSYLDATPRVTGERDRRQVWTSWRFDQGSRLKRAVAGAGTPDSVAFAYSAQESRSLAAAPPHLVYTAFDGPRPDTDVNDRTYFQVDRRGAPVEVKDALGYVTRVFREDPLWPGQVTRVRYQNGREVTSTFDEAGRLSSTTDWATSAGGRFATTLYEWDARCGAVSRVTMPEGEVSSRGYDARCMPAWTQAGADTLGRVRFAYHPLTDPSAPGLPASVTTPAAGGNPAATESFAYDVRGNLRRVTSPTGLEVWSWSDAIGRDTLLTSPIDAADPTKVTRQRMAYDAADRVVNQLAIGPAIYGVAVSKTVRVETRYDRGGLPLFVTRTTTPDTAVGPVTTGYRYNALGRQVAEIDPIGATDSTGYDAAGNIVGTTDRSARSVSIRYDALNRPLRRTAGSQVDRFRYDPMGNLVSATNDNARITRSYFDNGLLRTDSIRIRTTTPSHADTLWTGYTAHVYGLAYEYDLNGRRARVTYPANLMAGSGIAGLRDHARYGYDPATGVLAWVEGLGAATRFDYRYDLLGRPDSVLMPGGLREKYVYDAEGRLKHRRTTAPAGGSWWAGGALRSDTLVYDARGKMTTPRVTVINAGGIGHGALQTSTYDGIGNLIAANHAFTSPFPTEQWNVDALGNQLGGGRGGDVAITYQNVYEKPTGRLKWTYPQGDTSTAVYDTTRYYHDLAGNTTAVAEWGKATFNPASATDQRQPLFLQRRVETYHYYDQNGRLDYLLRDTNQGPGAGVRVRETYAYDALGRRVWRRAYNGWDVTTQTQRDTVCLRPQPSSECRSFVERTVWDGDQVLLEIRAPLEPGQFEVSNPESETGGGGDQRFYGRVAYVHAGGIDQPLELVRMDTWQPFAAVPHANWRGTYDVVTLTGSRYAQCGPQIGFELGTQPECFPFELASINAFGEVKPKNPDGTDPGPRSWAGSLITGSRDASGLLYRRNRYLDPKSGRFTQEDPIGLAGGLNAYGFANGDPVTYSDPFGLCAEVAGDTTPGGGKVCKWEPAHSGYIESTGGIGPAELVLPAASGPAIKSLALLSRLRAGLAALLLKRLSSEGGEHIALGLGHRLTGFAQQVDGRTYRQWGGNDWRGSFLRLMRDPSTRVSFDLTDVDVWPGVARAASGIGGATDWELYMIKSNSDWWSRITFYENGKLADNPFQ